MRFLTQAILALHDCEISSPDLFPIVVELFQLRSGVMNKPADADHYNISKDVASYLLIFRCNENENLYFPHLIYRLL